MQQFESYPLAFQTLAVRRGEQPLLAQTFSASWPNRSLERARLVDIMVYEKPAERGHLVTASPSKSRRTSKGGLKGLFQRTRSVKALVSSDLVETSRDEADVFQRVVTRDAVVASNNEAAVVPLEIPSRSTLPARSNITSSHPSSKVHHKEPPLSSPTIWAAPSLFEAYPQAVKYATLLAPNLSAAATIRHDTLRRNISVGHRHKPNESKSEIVGSDALSERIHKYHKRQISEATSKQDWTRNIYLLTTSGYLLQYANEGSLDRLPEKIMQLRKDSVAFASDAIPGEHWVLQISQLPDIEGTVSTDASKSFFGKLGPRAHVERDSTSFFLILDSSEEMDSWLIATRKEIQALGETKFQPELQVCDPTTDESQQLRKRSNARYQIRKNAEQVYNALARVPPSKFTVAELVKADRWTKRVIDAKTAEYGGKHSFTSRRSMDSPTISSLSRSTDKAPFGRPRDFSTASDISAGSRTLIPSGESSATNSPVTSTFTFSDAYTKVNNHTSSSILGTEATQPNSMQMLSISQHKSETWQARPHRQSSYLKEPSGFDDRSLAAQSCWISDVRKPYASAMASSLALPPTPPASATSIEKSFSVPTTGNEDGLSNRPSSIVGELSFPSGQLYSSGTLSFSCLNPKPLSLKSCLPNLSAPSPLLSPTGLTSFDLYGSSHTRPRSASIKADVAIPQRNLSVRYSGGTSFPSIKASSFSPPTRMLPVSPSQACSRQKQCQESQPTSARLTQASELIHPHLLSTKSDTAVPRRYSSIENTRVPSQRQSLYQTKSPPSPPTVALSAVPSLIYNVQQQQGRQWFTGAHSEQAAEPSHPASMHAPSDLVAHFQRESSLHQPNSRASIQYASPIATPPSSQEQRRINNGRSTSQIPSMPLLGPPISPPPSCPLPSIPSIVLTQSKGSLRNYHAYKRREVVAGDDSFRDASGEMFVWGC